MSLLELMASKKRHADAVSHVSPAVDAVGPPKPPKTKRRTPKAKREAADGGDGGDATASDAPAAATPKSTGRFSILVKREATASDAPAAATPNSTGRAEEPALAREAAATTPSAQPARAAKPFGAGREANLFESAADRKNKWARYMQTFVPENTYSGRTSKTVKVPGEVMSELGGSGGVRDRQWWFANWVQAGGNWQHVDYKEIQRSENADIDATTKEWITRDQCVDLYRSAVVGNALCDAALQSPSENKLNPKIPWLEEARLFLVQPTITITITTTTTTTTRF